MDSNDDEERLPADNNDYRATTTTTGRQQRLPADNNDYRATTTTTGRQQRLPADNNVEMLTEGTSGDTASRPINKRDNDDADFPDADSNGVPSVTSLGTSALGQSRSASAGVDSAHSAFDDRYRVVDGFLYGVEPMRRQDILNACPRLLWQMADDAWRPEVIELEFGEPEKRPLPDYYYISMKTQVPGAASINRKRK